MPVTLTLSDTQAQALFVLALSQMPPASGGEPVTLATILTELKAMSQTQTQQQTDVAQITADLQGLKGAFDALKQQISDLQATAAANAGKVPADLQAQIDALHTFAQSVAPPADTTPPAAPQPAPTGDVTAPSTSDIEGTPTAPADASALTQEA